MDPTALIFIALAVLSGLLCFGNILSRWSSGNRLSSLPGTEAEGVEIRMEIEPIDADGSRWKWHTYFVIGGQPGHYDGHHARGEVRDEAKAWEKARACADDARARYAAEQVRRGKKRSDRLPL